MKIKTEEENFWGKISTFIVDKRNAFFLFFIGLIIFSAFSLSWVEVNDNLIDYLPETTETRRGITIMEDEFITYASAKVMVSNITFEEGEKLAIRLGGYRGCIRCQL
ncbi:MAG: hypothetical protein GX366_06215 [Epulopiscium sp.]|nr:hypothetical protein [Candidatus Epulonipiscium sp.]